MQYLTFHSDYLSSYKVILFLDVLVVTVVFFFLLITHSLLDKVVLWTLFPL